MKRPAARYILAVLLAGLMCGGGHGELRGQSSGADGAPGRISELPYRVYLKDRDGNLVLVPDFSLEEYHRLVLGRAGRPAAAERPAFVVKRMDAEGTLDGDSADSDSATLTVRVTLEIPESAFRSDRAGRARSGETPAAANGATSADAASRNGSSAGTTEGEDTGSEPAGDDASPRNASDDTALNGEVDQGEPTVGKPETGRWFVCPLYLHRAVLLEEPVLKGGERQFIVVAPKEGGLRWWFFASRPHKLQATLRIRLPVERIAAGRKLAGRFPDALLGSLRLRLPSLPPQATVEVVAAGTSRAVPRAEGTTNEVVSIDGIRGETELRWHVADDGTKSDRGVDVSGSIRVQIAGPGDLSAEGQFQVAFLGEIPPSLRLRLPPGMELRVREEPGLFDMRVVRRDAERGDLVEVRPAEGHSAGREWAFRVACETTRRVGDQGKGKRGEGVVSEPAQFVFPSAIRHRGTIECGVEGDWLVTAEPDEGVVREEGSALSFRYFSQPSRLRLRIRARQTRGRVEATHTAAIDANRVELDSTYRFHFSRTVPRRLVITYPGWTVDDVLIGGQPPAEPFQMAERGRLEVPLVAGPSIEGDVELRVTAHRDMSPAEGSTSGRLQFDLPRPQAGGRGLLFVRPAQLALRPASNIELVPQLDELQNLTTVPASIDDESPDSSGRPGELHFRERGMRERARFVADYTVHDRMVEVESDTRIVTGERHIDVRRFLICRVRYAPVYRVRLWVPTGLLQDDRRVMCVVRDDVAQRGAWADDELRLPVRPVEVDSPRPGMSAAEVLLPTGRSGPFLLSFQYEVEWAAVPGDDGRESEEQAGRQADIELIVADAFDGTRPQVMGEYVLIEQRGEWRVAVDSAGWEVSPVANEPSLLMCRAKEPMERLRLRQQDAGSNHRAGVLVRDVWVQSWWTQTKRRDRAVWNLVSDGRRLRLRLPAGVDWSDRRIVVAVGGKRVSRWQRVGGHGLEFLLAPDDIGRPIVVEVWYELEPTLRDGRPSLERPRIEQAIVSSETIWQIVLPRDQVLWSLAGPWAAVREGGWSAWWHERWMTQEQLESRLGASRQPPLPVTCRAYVVSSLLAPSRLEFTTYRRSLVLLGAGSLVLLGGWLLLEWRRLRHPATLVAISLGVWTAASFFPLQAMLFARAGLVAGVMVAVAVSVNVWQGRRDTSVASPPPQPPTAEPISASGEAEWALTGSATSAVVHSSDSVGSRG